MRLPWPIRLLIRFIVAFVLLLLYGPLLFTVVTSFVDLKQGRIDWSSFGLQWYVALLNNHAIADALVATLQVGLAAVLAALVLGTLLAFWYQSHPGPWRELLQATLFLPFLLPPIVTGLSLLIYFRELGVERSLFTVAVAHTIFVLALVYRIVLTRLQQLDPRLIEASFDLGGDQWRTFRHVVLPHLASAAATAGLLAFALSFDETMITLLVTGTDSTLPMRLWAMMRTGFTPDINALVALILAGTTGLCLVLARFVRL